MVPGRSFHLFTAALCIMLVVLTSRAYGLQDQQPNIPIEQFTKKLEPVRDIVEKGMREGRFPGAVVVVGTPEGVVYSRAFGYRSLEPRRLPMTEDTIFDV